jgi:rod shape determining protein RodA
MNQNNIGISKGIDWSLVGLYLLLVAIGIIAIFGVTYHEGDPVIASFFSFKTDYSKQLYFFLLAGIFAIFILLTDSKFFPATANLWYAAGIL